MSPIDERRAWKESIDRSALRTHPAAEHSDPPPSTVSLDRQIERIVKRVGWVWAVLVALAGAFVWAFSMGVASTRYVTTEQRAKDVVEAGAKFDELSRELRTISERLTRVEEQNRGTGETVKEIKAKLDAQSMRSRP